VRRGDKNIMANKFILKAGKSKRFKMLIRKDTNEMVKAPNGNKTNFPDLWPASATRRDLIYALNVPDHSLFAFVTVEIKVIS